MGKVITWIVKGVLLTPLFLLFSMKSYAQTPQNLDMILCIDVSRSIQQDKMQSALEAVAERLTKDDTVTLILFADRPLRIAEVYEGDVIKQRVSNGNFWETISSNPEYGSLNTNRTNYTRLKDGIRGALQNRSTNADYCRRIIDKNRRPLVVILSDGEQDSDKSKSVKNQINELSLDLFSLEISNQEYSIPVDVRFFVISHHSGINADEKRQLWQRIVNGSRYFFYYDMTSQITADSIYDKITKNLFVYFKPCFRNSEVDLKFTYVTSSLAIGSRVPIRIELYRESDGSPFWNPGTTLETDLLASDSLKSLKNGTITDYFKNLDIESNRSELFDVRLSSTSKTQVMLIPTRIRRVPVLLPPKVYIELTSYNVYSGKAEDDFLFNVIGGTQQYVEAQYTTLRGFLDGEPEHVPINTVYRPLRNFKKTVHLRFIDNERNPVEIHLKHQPFPYSLFNHSALNKVDIISIDSHFNLGDLFTIYKLILIFGICLFGTYLLCFFMVKDRKALICKIKKIGRNIPAKNGSPDFSVDEFKGRYTLTALCTALKRDNLPVAIDNVEELNELIKIPYLYEELIKTNTVRQPSEELKKHKEAYNKSKSEYDLKLLNRLLLEEFYPQETPKKNESFLFLILSFVGKIINFCFDKLIKTPLWKVILVLIIFNVILLIAVFSFHSKLHFNYLPLPTQLLEYILILGIFLILWGIVRSLQSEPMNNPAAETAWDQGSKQPYLFNKKWVRAMATLIIIGIFMIPFISYKHVDAILHITMTLILIMHFLIEEIKKTKCDNQ